MLALGFGHFLGLGAHIPFGIFECPPATEFALLLKWLWIDLFLFLFFSAEKKNGLCDARDKYVWP